MRHVGDPKSLPQLGIERHVERVEAGREALASCLAKELHVLIARHPHAATHQKHAALVITLNEKENDKYKTLYVHMHRYLSTYLSKYT